MELTLRLRCFSLCFLFATLCFAHESCALEVLYLEFPPYYYTNKRGAPDGFLLNKTRAILRDAGVEGQFKSVPAKRIMQEIRHGGGVVSIGWFKTSQREQFARFSLPIYSNLPLQILFLKKNRQLFEDMGTLDALMRSQELLLGCLDGYSYGAAVDERLKQGKPRIQEVVGGFPQLVRMLAAERFSYILIAPEEANALIEGNGLSPTSFQTQKLNDIPEGNQRYLMFSMDVPVDVIESINKVIGAMGPEY